MLKVLIMLTLMSANGFAALPSSYTELLEYIQEAPDQGETNTCLFVASTGAMEILANKHYNIKNPAPGGRFDLSESYVMHAADNVSGKSFFERTFLRFNTGHAIHVNDWPFEAWKSNDINHSVWSRHPHFSKLPKLPLFKVETIKLFQYGNRWSTNVVGQQEIDAIKSALVRYKSPVLVNYNDEGFWHVILIVGYDDALPGECYDTDPRECEGDIGSFYVRDSFGIPIELRDYDWFRVKGNAAFVTKKVD